MRLRITYNHIWAATFIAYLAANYASIAGFVTGLWVQIPLYLVMAETILLIISKKQHFPRQVALWYGGFVIISLLSCMYSINLSTSFSVVKDLFLGFLWAIALGTFLQQRDNEQILKYGYICISIPCGIYLIATFRQVHWWDRLGTSLGWNPNVLALAFIIPFCFAINELMCRKYSVLNVMAVVVSIYTIFLTGSKKGLLGVVVFLAILFYFRERISIKKICILLGFVALVIGVYYYIMSNKLLYDIIGFRLQMFFYDIDSENANQLGSTSIRNDMIQYGIKQFVQSPIFGHGINSFRDMYGGQTGFYAYAHNNYIEMLADLGIVGFVCYYYIHFRIARKSMRIGNLHNRSYILALLALILFYDWAMVSYYDTRIILLLCMGYAESCRRN